MHDKNRRNRKVSKKTDHRGIELASARTEFSIDRKASGQDFIFFEGYASIFNTADSYNDIILPGAFKSTLAEKGPREADDGSIDSDIVSLWQHNPDWPFGLPQQMSEDSTGLWHRTMISNTRENADRVQYMEDKVVKGESIGFMTTDAEWADEDEDDLDSFWPLRYIKGVDLWEISPVTFAAHSDAVTTLIQRNRELALAVKSVNHGSILEMAHKMKGISVPQIEETIQILTAVQSALDTEEPEVPTGTEGGGEEDFEDVPDTGDGDPELVRELESLANEMELSLIAEKMNRR